MKINETTTEVRRFLRVTQDGFDRIAEASGGEYVLSYGMSIQTNPGSASDIKSLLAAIEKSIAAFAGDARLAVQLDINHQNGFDGSLLREVKNGYETSKKIEDATSKAS